MKQEIDLEKILLEAKQQAITRFRTELAEKKVELGQVRTFNVDRDHPLRKLNGAEIRVISIDQESGKVGFELTVNNNLDILKEAKTITKEAEISSLFEPLDITLEEKFRESIAQRKIEIRKIYVSKKALLPEIMVKVLDIDYTNQWIEGEFQMFGVTKRALFETEELGEEI